MGPEITRGQKTGGCGLTKAEYSVVHFAGMCGRSKFQCKQVIQESFKDFSATKGRVGQKEVPTLFRCEGRNSTLFSMPGKLASCRVN